MMDEMKRTDKLFLILHKAGWSVGDTAFVGKEGISWLVFGTRGELSLLTETTASGRVTRRASSDPACFLRGTCWPRHLGSSSEKPLPSILKSLSLGDINAPNGGNLTQTAPGGGLPHTTASGRGW